MVLVVGSPFQLPVRLFFEKKTGDRKVAGFLFGVVGKGSRIGTYFTVMVIFLETTGGLWGTWP